jgi:hypothetical protein
MMTEIGGWLSTDPIVEAGGVNLYGYVLDDPINGWDPYGLEFWTWGDSDSDDWFLSAGEMGENMAQLSMGMADNLSFGLNGLAREQIYGANYSDPCSKAYKGGSYAGTAIELATGVGGIAKGLTKGGFKVAAGAAYKNGTSMAYKNVRNRLSYHGIVGKGEHLHHWLISQARAKKWGITNSILNHRANLMPLSEAAHISAHRGLLGRLANGIPGYAKQIAAGFGAAAVGGNSGNCP